MAGNPKSAKEQAASPARTPRPPLYVGISFSIPISITKFATVTCGHREESHARWRDVDLHSNELFPQKVLFKFLASLAKMSPAAGGAKKRPRSRCKSVPHELLGRGPSQRPQMPKLG